MVNTSITADYKTITFSPPASATVALLRQLRLPEVASENVVLSNAQQPRCNGLTVSWTLSSEHFTFHVSRFLRHFVMMGDFNATYGARKM